MVWLLMQIHDREGMHSICFREGESPTYVLRNECVVLNQVVTVCPAIVPASPYFLLSPLILTAPPLLGNTFYELEKKTFEVLSDTTFWSSAVTPCGLKTEAKPQGTV